MSRNIAYKTGNLLDYLYHQKWNIINSSYHKQIGINSLRQINTNIPQQINFIGKLAEDNGATMFLITEKHHKTILNFSLDLLNVTD